MEHKEHVMHVSRVIDPPPLKTPLCSVVRLHCFDTCRCQNTQSVAFLVFRRVSQSQLFESHRRCKQGAKDRRKYERKKEERHLSSSWTTQKGKVCVTRRGEELMPRFRFMISHLFAFHVESMSPLFAGLWSPLFSSPSLWLFFPRFVSFSRFSRSLSPSASGCRESAHNYVPGGKHLRGKRHVEHP